MPKYQAFIIQSELFESTQHILLLKRILKLGYCSLASILNPLSFEYLSSGSLLQRRVNDVQSSIQ